MKSPPKARDESARIQALLRLGILDTPSEETFDRIARVATALLNVPIALVVFVDTDRQWFKSCVGLEATQTDRAVSFCGHVILGDDLFVVEDAQADPRFADNPLVTGAPYIRFYAGAPIRSPDGFKVGTLCVIDQRPGSLTTDQRARLRDLADIVERELVARTDASTDPLTGALNRRTLDGLVEHEIERARRTGSGLAVVSFDIDRFKALNDTHGHAAGDAALTRIAAACRRTLRATDTLFRTGGEEFLAILPTTRDADAAAAGERLRVAVARERIVLDDQTILSVTVSVGVASLRAGQDETVHVLHGRADQAMYAAKRAGGNRVACAGAGSSGPARQHASGTVTCVRLNGA